jgi:hypothetical protein
MNLSWFVKCYDFGFFQSVENTLRLCMPKIYFNANNKLLYVCNFIVFTESFSFVSIS